jgi:hypothetical protein
MFGCLEEYCQQKCQFTSGVNCLVTLATVLKKRAPGDDHSLKIRWMQFMQLSFAVLPNKSGMLPDY